MTFDGNLFQFTDSNRNSNVRLILILIPIYVEWLNNTDSYRGFGVSNGFQKMVSDGGPLFSFSLFSCEKLKRGPPSEAVPGFADGVTTIGINFLLNCFFSKYYLLLYYTISKNNTLLTTSLSIYTMAAMALPLPRPKPCP